MLNWWLRRVAKTSNILKERRGISHPAPTTGCRVAGLGGGATSGNCTSTNTRTIAQENDKRPMLERYTAFTADGGAQSHTPQNSQTIGRPET